MTNIEALQNVPEVNFINTNVETLLNSFIQSYEANYKAATGEEKTLYPTDKERIWANTAALVIYQALMISDLETKQNFLKYAKGAALDNVGATRHSLKRDIPQYASVPEKITLSKASAGLTIPAGTRVTAGDNVFFALETNSTIAIGQTEATFVFKCTEAGEIGNDYSIGSINTIVDPVPYVQSVTNTEISQGGADIQSDDSFTQEIWEAPEGYAVAGPEEAYIYRAKTFNQDIDDVVAYSPDDKISFEYTFKNDSNVDTTQTPTISTTGTLSNASNISSYDMDLSTGAVELHFTKPVSVFKGVFPRGGIINIVPLLKDATIPTETFLNELKTFLSADKYRPLSDKVQTLAPTIENYTVNFKYWIDSKDSASEQAIQTAVTAAVSSYTKWQGAKLSRDINPDELRLLVKNAGAKRLEITSPVYKKLADTQIAKCTSVTFSYEGLE